MAKPSLAFLGPLGTYSHQIAHDIFQNSVSYAPQDSIADVLHSVGLHTPLAVIPRENSTHGPVIETWDLFRLSCLGDSVFIRAQVTLEIQHCLLVRSGVKLGQIQRVWSHEQALGQCSQFLSEHLPGASREAKLSTGSAAQLLSALEPDDPTATTTAAICSRLCLELFPGLEIAHEDIQNEKDNLTRFLVLSNAPATPLPVAETVRSVVFPGTFHAVVRISPPTAETSHIGRPLRRTDVFPLLQALSQKLDITNIDKRPSLHGRPFDSVYFVELESVGSTPRLEETAANGTISAASSENDDEDGFLIIVDRNIRLVRELGMDVTLLGYWQGSLIT